MLGDAPNHFKHTTDLADPSGQHLKCTCGLLDVAVQHLDSAGRAADAQATLLRTLACAMGNFRGRCRISCHLFYRTGQFCHGAGRLIELGTLPLQARRSLGRHFAQYCGRCRQLLGAGHHLAHRATQIALHAVQRLQQTRRLIATVDLQRFAQITASDSFGSADGYPQLAEQTRHDQRHQSAPDQ
ncbi:hypothetical protein FQZ97_670720 [compost metagenome]